MNALQRMIQAKIHGVEFIAVNTDAQDLHSSGAPVKIHIGKSLTRGLGAGMNPDIGRQAAEDTKEEIINALKGADMVFIAYGLGGGTGTGAGPIIADLAREVGALTVAVVTKPFSFEGAQRMKISEDGWNILRDKVDALITIPNDRLLSIIDRKTPLLEAFAVVDDVLRQGVQGISDLITIPGVINVDFADVKTIMQNAGSALMGIGIAQGEKRAEEAAKMAINSPLLYVTIDGAKGVLFAISAGEDLTMLEVQKAAAVITASIDPDAKVIFGTINDDKLKKGEVKVTVIASGFSGMARKIMPKSIAEEQESETESIDTSNVSQKKEEETKEETSGIKALRDKVREIEKDENGDDEDSSWDVIPAFLRRNK